MCIFVFISAGLYWRSNEDTESVAGAEGREEGANRDTRAEIGEN